MIDPKELRIGNYVHKIDAAIYDDKIEYSNRLYVIGHNDIYHIVEDDDPTNHPIDITPERLLKFGFKKADKSPYRDCEAYVIFSDANRLIWCEGNLFKPLREGFVKITSFDLLHDTQPIKYIHLLQNLISDLTGHELKLTK
jgi:hypothetical protein